MPTLTALGTRPLGGAAVAGISPAAFPAFAVAGGRLPRPEADIFVGEGGLEYLFGLLLEEDGRPVYRKVWAHCLEDEKAAFGRVLVDASLATPNGVRVE